MRIISFLIILIFLISCSLKPIRPLSELKTKEEIEENQRNIGEYYETILGVSTYLPLVGFNFVIRGFTKYTDERKCEKDPKSTACCREPASLGFHVQLYDPEKIKSGMCDTDGHPKVDKNK